MKLFLSRSVHKIDKKGRVSVPAGFRAALEGAIDDGLSLYIPLSGIACIEAAPMAMVEDMIARLSFENSHRPEVQAVTHRLIGSMTQVNFDGEGRIMLPDYLRSHAGISDITTFVGMARTFQIWDPEKLAEHDVHTAEIARDNIHLLDQVSPSSATDA